jgi:hypothetical protein
MSAHPRAAPPRLFAAACLLLSAAALGGLLHAAYAAFTGMHFHFLDYGGYTNMLWNTAHGRPFAVLVDRTYLQAHLSFSLAVLAPLFRLWDHPFLLAAVQWAGLAGGAALVWRIGGRAGYAPALRAACVLFFTAYPFTQSVVLSEFHGVGLYLLLLPWLYHALRFRPGAAWLPLALTLGVREDAFLVVVPLIVTMAVRRRSRVLALLAAAALLYGVAAVFVLYPLINGASLFAFRANWFPSGGGGPDAAAILERVKALAGVLLPAAVLGCWAGRRAAWGTLAGCAGVPLLIALASTAPHQYGLRVHYPAAVMVCLVLGIMEAMCAQPAPPAKGWRGGVAAAYLAGLTLVAHCAAGFLPGGHRRQAVYARVNPEGPRVLALARTLPREGILLCAERLSVFCANRAELLVPQFYDPARHTIDVFFFAERDVRGRVREVLEAALHSGAYAERPAAPGYRIVVRSDR